MATGRRGLSGKIQTCSTYPYIDMTEADFILLAILALWIWSVRDLARGGQPSLKHLSWADEIIQDRQHPLAI